VLFLRGRRCANGEMHKNDAQGEADCAATTPAPFDLVQTAQRTSPSSGFQRKKHGKILERGLCANLHNEPHLQLRTLGIENVFL
jgi:hypothetical protein